MPSFTQNNLSSVFVANSRLFGRTATSDPILSEEFAALERVQKEVSPGGSVEKVALTALKPP